ncbi:MAG: DUF4388 domain-containing protein [Planctomycetota bacterium]|nr:MAG: DUF4388 domain-containing protein [Planctomycetota bacterium]
MSTQSSPIIELPDIVQSLQNKQWTGTLEIIAEEGRSTHLYFQSGMIQHVAPDRNPLPLGKALNKLGLIDEADYVMTMIDYEQTGRPCGEVLKELGLVGDDEIREALSYQAREHVLEVFEWENVDVRFDAGDGKLEAAFTPQQREVKLMLAGMSLLMEAARRSDEWGIVREAIPSEHDVLAATDPSGLLPPGLVDRRLRLLVDGYRSAQEVAEAAPMPTLEVLKTLAELIQQGHLKLLSPPELAQVGVVAEADGDLEKALRVFELASSRGLDHIDLHKKIARTQTALGRTTQALRAWEGVAERCVRMQRSDLALEALREASALDPENLDLGERLAKYLVAAGETTEAAERMRSLIELASRKGNEVSSARRIALMDAYLELAPTDKEILEACAGLHLEADDKLSAMVRLDELAAVWNSEGRLEEATAIYYRILEIDAENLEARLLLAQTLAKMGSTDDAVREYRRLADILYRSGVIGNAINWPFLIKVYEAIVELEPSSTAAWEWLAKAYIEDGQHDMAVSRFIGMADSLQPAAGEPHPPEILPPLRSVVELAPHRLDVRRRLVDAYLALHQTEPAVAALRGFAEEALRQDKIAAAVEAYEEALEHQPFDMDSRRGLAAIQETKGDYEAAFLAWRSVGGMCQRAGLYEQAARDLHRAFQLREDDPETVRTLAEVEAKRGRGRNAAMLFARYAQLAFARDDRGSARDALERARQLEPGLPQLQALAAQLGAAS